MREFISNVTAGFGITDIIDILVVAYIVYKVLGFIRETRAQQLVNGILLLLGAYLVSDLANLHTLNWLLKGVMTMGFIAVIILFQPELRRALEYMGRGRFVPSMFNDVDKDGAKRITDEFVKAIDNFSETRTGALIIIEREVSLGDIIESGTVIDAEISAEMIGNVFYKGAPLHDGAAIIRGEKIYAAGCVLPLTSSLEINKELGTRHRAGIGITENSDAVALIVSEENGVISVAKGGKLTRFLDSKAVEKLLLNLYLSPEDEETALLPRLKKFMRGGKTDA